MDNRFVLHVLKADLKYRAFPGERVCPGGGFRIEKVGLPGNEIPRRIKNQLITRRTFFKTPGLQDMGMMGPDNVHPVLQAFFEELGLFFIGRSRYSLPP